MSSRSDFHSNLFKHFGNTFSPEVFRALDHEAYNYEVNKESKIADLEKHLDLLRGELDITKANLKKLQESRFKSRERDLAVADSTLAERYDNLVNEVKGLVLNLTRPVSGNANHLLQLMGKSKQYQVNLQKVLEPNVSVQHFVELMQHSRAPAKLLAFVLRAIVLNILKSGLFNTKVFYSLGGDDWKALTKVYRALLTSGKHLSTTKHPWRGAHRKFSKLETDAQAEEPELLVPPVDYRARKDASLWRSQTLSTFERNKDRLHLVESRRHVYQKISNQIEELLSPLLVSDKAAKDGLKTEIESLVEQAADLSLKLGKQRAMFEFETKTYLGFIYKRPPMEDIGPSATDSEESDDQPSPQVSLPVLVVVVPALYKFGNDDGEDFDSSRIVRPAQVVLMPKPQPTTAAATSSEKGKLKEASGSIKPVDENATTSDAKPKTKDGQNVPQAEEGIKPPVPPKDEQPAKVDTGPAEQKVRTEDLNISSLEAQKVKHKSHKTRSSMGISSSHDSSSRTLKRKGK
ncbi:hypothetical protein ABW19_dt0205099 [Dactylella cylindrospora]|nr:hypothetical protein ABW19_dt0205099 [Dactylella cylindrospora]